MKTKIIKLALIATFGIVAASTASAAENHYTKEGHGLTTTDERTTPYGYTAPLHNADYKTELSNSTDHSLNVNRLETVHLNLSGKELDWTFDTLETGAFPLSRILPGAENITVYVSENPFYQTGS